MIDQLEFAGLLVQKVKKHGTQRGAAKALGVSPQYLGDVLNGHREPGKKILAAMGYRRIVAYEKIR